MDLVGGPVFLFLSITFSYRIGTPKSFFFTLTDCPSYNDGGCGRCACPVRPLSPRSMSGSGYLPFPAHGSRRERSGQGRDLLCRKAEYHSCAERSEASSLSGASFVMQRVPLVILNRSFFVKTCRGIKKYGTDYFRIPIPCFPLSTNQKV